MTFIVQRKQLTLFSMLSTIVIMTFNMGCHLACYIYLILYKRIILNDNDIVTKTFYEVNKAANITF